MKQVTKRAMAFVLAAVMIVVMAIPTFAYTSLDDDGDRSNVKEGSYGVVYGTAGMLRLMDEGTSVRLNADDTVTVTAKTDNTKTWGKITKLALIEQEATVEEKDAASADVVFNDTTYYADEAASRIITFTIPLADVGRKIPVCRYVSSSDTEGAWTDFSSQPYYIVESYNIPTELELTNNVSMFRPESLSVSGKEGMYTLHLTMGSTAYDEVFVGYASDADDAQALSINAVEGKGYVDIPVASLEEPIVLAFHGSKWYNRTLTVDLEEKTAVFDPTVIPLERFENMTAEEAIARASEDTSVDTVNELIEAIQVQYRDENTDKYCKIAKAYYDALSDDEESPLYKGLLDDPDYFGADTGDATKDKIKEAERQAAEIGEKELLVVSFGTSFNESRVKTILAVENALEEAYPDYSVRRAFTAQIIINHIASREGYTIDDMEMALDRAVEAGVKELVVQPTHLMHGYEYDEMVEVIAEYGDEFEKIAISDPLLSSDNDKRIVAQYAVGKVIADGGYNSIDEMEASGTAIVFMGHGTEHPANETYTEMQEVMDEYYNNVFVGTVEGLPDGTDADSVLAKVQDAGYTSVILRPLMVVAGDHANNDMADTDDPESWASVFGAGLGADNVKCQINGLGEIEEVQQLYVEHVKDILSVEPAAPADITVSIADKGEVKVALEDVTVIDLNEDGKLDIDEALYAAHEKCYEGGAAVGYASEETQWGLGITKLWGDESGNYGYYLNDDMAWNLSDAVSAGNYLVAWIYKDAETWSDSYSFFDARSYNATAEAAFTVKLSNMVNDENYNPVPTATSGATLTLVDSSLKAIDASKYSVTDNGDGTYAVTAYEAGDFYLTASSDNGILVPAVAKLHVDAAPAKQISDAVITLAGTSYKYTGKAITPQVTVRYQGGHLQENVHYTISYKNNINAGNATVTITGKGQLTGTTSKTFKITKAANTLKVKVAKKTYKKAKVNKKKATFKIGATKGQGKVTYTLNKKAKNAKIKVTKKGKVTVPKKCKKGTYKITVKAAGNANYNAGKKVVTIIVK